MSDLVTAADIELPWDVEAKGLFSNSPCWKLKRIGDEVAAWVEKLDRCGSKAVDYVDTINRLLEDAKKLCDAEGFEAFKQHYCPKLGQSRTYELLAIREGRKTLEEIRKAGRLRVAKHRAAKRVTERIPLHPR